MYGQGTGVAQSYLMSFIWFSLAAELGEADAATPRDLTADLLKAEELERAESMLSILRENIGQ
jgi:TPR repeat protein